MKYYELTAVVDGEDIRLRKNIFRSRDDAINYMFKYYRNHYLFNLQVEDEYAVSGNKHCIEYICDTYNRFTVARI